jgi:hypothetical protein
MRCISDELEPNKEIFFGVQPVRSDTTSIMLSKDGAPIACGGTLNAGDTNLKFIMSGNPSGSEFLIDTVATAGYGSWGIQSGKCNNLRVYNSGGNSYTVPPSGEVTIRASWSTGERNKINVSPDCRYTITGTGAPAAAPTTVKNTATSTFATLSTSLASLMMAFTVISYTATSCL